MNTKFFNLFFVFLLLFPSLSISSCTSTIVGHSDWYEVTELKPNVFLVREPSEIDANFFILREGNKALFIDSGIGLSSESAKALLTKLGIKTFQVVNTHSHYDHVGLNYLAKKIYIGQLEWAKYLRQTEIDQTKNFLAMEPNGPRPEGFDLNRKQQPWRPSGFITPGKNILFGPFVLVPIFAPGHSRGHFIFHEPRLNLLFTGDLVYDGLNYLHLADSSLDSYKRSLEALTNFIETHPKVTLLPCHNTIPLSSDYPKRVLELAEAVKKGEVPVQKNEPKNKIFEEGKVFEKDGVKLILTK